MTHPPQAGSSEGPDTAAVHLTHRKEKSGRGTKTQYLSIKSPPAKC